MIAMVGADHRVYLGKPENCYLSPEGDAPAYYDNSDHSLQLISDNIKMFHFLYSRDLPMSQREMRRRSASPKQITSSLPACGRESSPDIP
ncbi:hypothetical protein [Dysosmobacter welbionis]|uniref:hypothetical protein n=1 Tax=Dysosmobacter welbionis TaxID=2093857 RepID=UPI00300ECFF6